MGTDTRGIVLSDRYELFETIGRDGMATVYRGRDRKLGRDVAVKVLDHRFAGDEGQVAGFLREARLAARIDHPNVVSVFDAGSDGEAHYIVMELVDAPSLADVLRAKGRLDVATSLGIAAEVASALQAVHEAGLVHHGLSARNVLMPEGGPVLVIDFSIAVALEDETLETLGRADGAMGTAHDLLLEESAEEAVDGRADVYALGRLLYAMLTGRLAFAGGPAAAVAAENVSAVPPPSARAPGVPAAVDAVVLRALAKDPADRYQSAGDMRWALAGAAAKVRLAQHDRTMAPDLPGGRRR